MRISKAGVIECPTPLWEILFGRGYHLWLIQAKGNKLIFTKKNEENCPPNTFDGDELYAEHKIFKKQCKENSHLFYISFKWKDNFEVEIID